MLDVGERKNSKTQGEGGKCLLSSLGPVVGVAIVTASFSVSLARCNYRNPRVLSGVNLCVCVSV